MGQYTYEYPHAAIAADCVVFGFDGHELKVLLITRGAEPFKGKLAFAGGFLRMDETVEECAARELREETGLQVNMLRQLGVFSSVERDPRERVVSVAFYALAKRTEVKAGDDAADAAWYSIDQVPQLAFDHDYILRQALQRIRRDIHFEPVGFGLLGNEFTMSELQRLYEAILGVKFDRRNFTKKMLQMGLLEEVGNERQPHQINPRIERHGMQRKDINALFRHTEEEPDATPLFLANANDDEPIEREIHRGRVGRLYRFNQSKYESMKRKNSFKLEF